MKATRNHSTKRKIIIPTVLARALNWWYRYPNASATRQHGRIMRYEYPDENDDYIMIEITERWLQSDHCLIRGLYDF